MLARPKFVSRWRYLPRLPENVETPWISTLIFGLPGLGKATLSYILANEMGSEARTTSGPVKHDKAGDLAALLTNLDA